MVQIGDVIVSPDIFTEYFCCDLEKCKGECCVEGDAGAPVTLEEVGELENVLEVVWPDLSAQAQAIIDKQGVAYTDQEGDLVTSIVGGKDCVFTYYDDLDIGTKEKPCVVKNCCLCATGNGAVCDLPLHRQQVIPPMAFTNNQHRADLHLPGLPHQEGSAAGIPAHHQQVLQIISVR